MDRKVPNVNNVGQFFVVRLFVLGAVKNADEAREARGLNSRL